MVDSHPTDDLAAYALGALDDDAAVRAHIRMCDRCTRELAEMQDVLFEAVAVGAPSIEPPRDLRMRIVERHRRGATTAVGWSARLRDLFARPVPLAVPVLLLVALVIAFAALGGVRGEADDYARALAGVADGRVVALAPSAENPDARGALVVSATGAPYLVLHLPAPPAGKAWEAWVLRPSPSGPIALPAGLTRSGGVFTLALNAPLAPRDGVAVTLEAAAGASQPTTQPVLAFLPS